LQEKKKERFLCGEIFSAGFLIDRCRREISVLRKEEWLQFPDQFFLRMCNHHKCCSDRK